MAPLPVPVWWHPRFGSLTPSFGGGPFGDSHFHIPSRLSTASRAQVQLHEMIKLEVRVAAGRDLSRAERLIESACARAGLFVRLKEPRPTPDPCTGTLERSENSGRSKSRCGVERAESGSRSIRCERRRGSRARCGGCGRSWNEGSAAGGADHKPRAGGIRKQRYRGHTAGHRRDVRRREGRRADRRASTGSLQGAGSEATFSQRSEILRCRAGR